MCKCLDCAECVAKEQGKEEQVSAQRLDVYVYQSSDGMYWCEWNGHRYEGSNRTQLEWALDRGLVPTPRYFWLADQQEKEKNPNASV